MYVMEFAKGRGRDKKKRRRRRKRAASTGRTLAKNIGHDAAVGLGVSALGAGWAYGNVRRKGRSPQLASTIGKNHFKNAIPLTLIGATATGTYATVKSKRQEKKNKREITLRI